MADVYASLQRVQTALKAPKGQYNSFGKYAYRSCEDILEAAKPLLAENGLTVVITDDIFVPNNAHVTLSDDCKRPTQVYVRAIVTVTAISDGSQVTNQALARLDDSKKGMDGAQLTGAASSYARKYALNGMFLIDDTKDADATDDNGKGKDEQPAKEAKKPARKAPKGSPKPSDRAINDKELAEMRTVFRNYTGAVTPDVSKALQEVLRGAGVERMGEGIPVGDYSKILSFMAQKITDSALER